MSNVTLHPTTASRSAAHRAVAFVAAHEVHRGEVEWFDAKKGFGFLRIAPSLKLKLGLGLENDLFVHGNDLGRIPFPKVLVKNQKVTFTLLHHPKGWRAVNVEVLP